MSFVVAKQDLIRFLEDFSAKVSLFLAKISLLLAKAQSFLAKAQHLLFLKSFVRLEFHFFAYFANREVLFANFQSKIAFLLAKNVHHYEKFVELFEIDLIFLQSL